MGFGLANLYSASGASAVFYVQLRHGLIGLFVFLILGWIVPVRSLNVYGYWIFGITCALLVTVLITGKIGGGSQRWIVVGPFRGQPSELAKLAVAIAVAKYFYTAKLRIFKLRDMWPVIAMIGLIAGLIFPEPDFGTAGFVAIIALAQLAFVPINRRSVMTVIAVGIGTMPIVWGLLLKDYQKYRVLSFLNPDLDPHGKGYNAMQSLVAIGSGGLNGKGFLEGTQTQLRFLPMRHTDFVYSVFAEEHGFWGTIVLFSLFAALAYLALEVARQSRDKFNRLLAVGVAAFLFFQFTINIAMVLRMFPVVGLPLPFFSYGGSTLMAVCGAIGVLIAIDRDTLGKRRLLQR